VGVEFVDSRILNNLASSGGTQKTGQNHFSKRSTEEPRLGTGSHPLQLSVVPDGIWTHPAAVTHPSRLADELHIGMAAVMAAGLACCSTSKRRKTYGMYRRKPCVDAPKCATTLEAEKKIRVFRIFGSHSISICVISSWNILKSYCL